MPSNYTFLKDLVEQQQRNQMILEMVNNDDMSDPWRYSEPPPWPLTLENNDANI